MRKLRTFLKINAVLLTVLTFAGLSILLLNGFNLYREYQDEKRFSQSHPNPAVKSSINGQKIDAGSYTVALYKQGEVYAEYATDLHFVDSRTGASVRLGSSSQQQIYGGRVIGAAHRGNEDSGFGYLGLAKTGDRNGQPLFDVLYLRFSDMKTFTLAKSVLAYDSYELDGKTFSAIYWDAQDRGHYVLFDSDAGAAAITRELDMQGKAVSSTTSNEAPQTKYF
jgi:hypothetical protein